MPFLLRPSIGWGITHGDSAAVEPICLCGSRRRVHQRLAIQTWKHLRPSQIGYPATSPSPKALSSRCALPKIDRGSCRCTVCSLDAQSQGNFDSNFAASGYCPLCLRSDEIPYFRLAWRLAFVTHCPIHHCRLRTVCPNCARSCWPATYASRHRFAARWGNLRHCPECGHDLADVDLEMDGQHQLSDSLFSRLTDEVTANSEFNLDYFRVLWSMCRLISRKCYRFAEAEIGSREGLSRVLASHKKGLTIEKQSTDVGFAIFSKAAWMMEEWPGRFVKACEKVNLSRTDFGGADKCSPAWFDELVKHRLAKTVNWITREDVADAVNEA